MHALLIAFALCLLIGGDSDRKSSSLPARGYDRRGSQHLLVVPFCPTAFAICPQPLTKI
jgi:hypothetical protein